MLNELTTFSRINISFDRPDPKRHLSRETGVGSYMFCIVQHACIRSDKADALICGTLERDTIKETEPNGVI